MKILNLYLRLLKNYLLFIVFAFYPCSKIHGQIVLPDSSLIQCWQLTSYSEPSFQKTDSSLNGFQHYKPSLCESDYWAINLGNSSSPYLPSVFYLRDQHPFLLNSSKPWIFFSEDALYFNSKAAFTNLNFYTGPKKEILVNLLHTQNVNAYLNFALSLHAYSEPGVFINQSQKGSSISLTANYCKKNLFFYTSFSKNNEKHLENGGISDRYFIEDTVVKPDDVSFKLENASSKFNNSNFFVNSGINVIKHNINQDTIPDYFAAIIYTYDYSTFHINYQDASTTYLHNDVDTSYNLNYYAHSYYGNASDDSRYLTTATNSLGLKINEGHLGIPFGISASLLFKQENYKYKISRMLTTESWAGSRMGQLSFFSLSHPNIKISANALFGISGERKNEKSLDGHLKILLFNSLIFSGHSELSYLRPNYFYRYYTSNHFAWSDTTPGLQNLTNEKRIKLQGDLTLNNQITLGTALVQLSDYIALNDSLPAQYADFIQVFSVQARAKFALGNFHSVSQVIFQNSSDTNAISIPMISIYQSLYHEAEWVENVMTAQVGIDFFYCTEYRSPQYIPSLGMYVQQHDFTIGNYPVLDVFFNFQIRRATLFFKIENASYRLLGLNSYSSPYYPKNPRCLRFGVSWNFYD